MASVVPVEDYLYFIIDVKTLIISVVVYLSECSRNKTYISNGTATTKIHIILEKDKLACSCDKLFTITDQLTLIEI